MLIVHEWYVGTTINRESGGIVTAAILVEGLRKTVSDVTEDMTA
jgi:hypothetical protein